MTDMDDLIQRLETAAQLLDEIAFDKKGQNLTRLAGKREGVLLAKSYAEEMVR